MILKAMKSHLQYLQTVRELSQLTERELSDVGLTRYDIREVARKTKTR